MRLATFLEDSREEILDQSVAFARTIPALAKLEEHHLRNHLPELLKAISADLRTAQSRTESIEKSHGDAATAEGQTAAQTHGLLRARLGLSIEQLVAEYRALRSSVLRLWVEAHAAAPTAPADILRFNEAVDQAVAESVEFYAGERERWRQIYLGVLGHDLRGPLNALSLTIDVMRAEGSGPPQYTAMLGRGVKRLTSLLDSLLEYSRASMGVGMTMQRETIDLALACGEEMELLRAAAPGSQIEFSASGNTRGNFDASRVREALGNLVSNAVKHGDPSKGVSVAVHGEADEVRIVVTNGGDIPADEFPMLFEPLYRRTGPATHTEHTHLGLGLFIARQIARAHDGDLAGTCIDHQVTFTIVLPTHKKLNHLSADAQ